MKQKETNKLLKEAMERIIVALSFVNKAVNKESIQGEDGKLYSWKTNIEYAKNNLQSADTKLLLILNDFY